MIKEIYFLPLNLIPDDTIENVVRLHRQVILRMRIHFVGYLMLQEHPFQYTSRHAYVRADEVHQKDDRVVLQIDKENLQSPKIKPKIRDL